MVDYKQQAQELFKILMTATGICEDIKAFNFLCNRYPELMKYFIDEIEEELQGVELPEISEEEQERQKKKLFQKIEEYENQKKQAKKC